MIFVHCYLVDTPGSLTLDKMVYIYNGNLPSGSSSMSQLALVYFFCVIDSYCSLFKYTLGIIVMLLLCYA